MTWNSATDISKKNIHNFITGDNLSPVTTTLVISNRRCRSQSCEYSANFCKNSKWPQWNNHGPGETDSWKSRVGLPLSYHPVVNTDAEPWTQRAGPRIPSRSTYYVSFLYLIFSTNRILVKLCWGLRTSLMKDVHEIFSPVFCPGICY